MGKVKELVKKIRSTDIEAMYVDAILESEEVAMDLNRSQLFQGERSDGTELPEYSFVSINFFNKPEGPIKLFDTGDFYKGFIFASKSGKAEFPLFITSKDIKTDELQTKYGTEIFGLNGQNLAGFSKAYVLPNLLKRIRTLLHL